MCITCVLCAIYCDKHLIFISSTNVANNLIVLTPVLKMRKLKFREFN